MFGYRVQPGLGHRIAPVFVHRCASVATLVAGLALVVACQATVPTDSAAETTSPPSRADFRSWLAELGNEAQATGISRSTIDLALASIEYNERVVELDRRQPEFTRPVWAYLSSAVSATRVEKGRTLLTEHRAVQDTVRRRYGISPRYQLAILGLETDYGLTLG